MSHGDKDLEMAHAQHGPTARKALATLAAACGGDEASLWVINESRSCLRLLFNSGEEADELELETAQPLNEGTVSEVFRTQKAHCHDGPFPHSSQSRLVDQSEEQFTHYQAAAPFQIDGKPRGVISVVQIVRRGEPVPDREWGLHEEALEKVVAACKEWPIGEWIASI